MRTQVIVVQAQTKEKKIQDHLKAKREMGSGVETSRETIQQRRKPSMVKRWT